MTDEIVSISEVSGVWVSVSELAEAKGITRASASERVLRLEEQGLIQTRPGKGRSKLVNLAEYDRVVGQVTDLGREQGQETRRGGDDGEGGTASAAYTAQQAKRAGYLAEIARLDLEERLGNLVGLAELGPVVEAAAQAVATTIDSLAHEADALREAAQGEDAAAFDRQLKALARQLRTRALENVRSAMPGRKRGGGEAVV